MSPWEGGCPHSHFCSSRREGTPAGFEGSRNLSWKLEKGDTCDLALPGLIFLRPPWECVTCIPFLGLWTWRWSHQRSAFCPGPVVAPLRRCCIPHTGYRAGTQKPFIHICVLEEQSRANPESHQQRHRPRGYWEWRTPDNWAPPVPSKKCFQSQLRITEMGGLPWWSRG